jgi:lipoate-protein ligase A
MALDIALDETLARRAGAVVRVWSPLERAGVLGVASRAADELLLDRCRADRLPVLRRSTGGAAVLLTPEVACFSSVMPHALHPEAKRISGAYALAFEGLARAFRELGLDVDFERPGDVAVSGRKIVGLAQARRRHATLVHGVVPVGLDHGLIERYIAHPPSEPAYRSGRRHGDFVTTLAHETGASDEGLMQRALLALAHGLCGGGSAEVAPDELGEVLAEARLLVDERYGRDDWTFRR